MKFAKYGCLWSLALLANEDGSKAMPVMQHLTVESADAPIAPSAAPAIKDFDGNASGKMLEKEKTHYRTFAEFLYWKRSSGIAFMTDATGWRVDPAGVLNEDINVSERGKAYKPEFDFSPGFNVGLGFDFARDNWDLSASYLWLRSEATRRFSRDPGRGWTSPYSFFTGGRVSHTNFAHEKTEETLNFFQAELGRRFHTSERLLLRPHIDIASLYVPATLDVDYDLIGALLTHRSAAYKCRSHILGFGAGVGLDTEWRLSENWAFLGDFTINTMWSSFQAKHQQKSTDFATGATVRDVLGGLSTNKILYLVDIFLGVQWWTKFHKGKCFVSTYAGWDFFSGLLHYFPGSNSLMFSEPYDYQGLRAGLKFGF